MFSFYLWLSQKKKLNNKCFSVFVYILKTEKRNKILYYKGGVCVECINNNNNNMWIKRKYILIYIKKYKRENKEKFKNIIS